MHDPADPSLAHAGADEHGKPHPAAGVDSEIPGDQDRFFQHPDGGQAVADEPAFDPGQGLGGIVGQNVDLHHHGGHALAGRGPLPVLRKDRRGRRVERPDGQARRQRHIGHEFRVAFPFQVMAAQPSLIMAGLRVRARPAMPRGQRGQVVQIAGRVAPGREFGLFEGQKDAGGRGRQPWRGPGMQFVGNLEPQRMFKFRPHPILLTCRAPA